MGIPLGTFTVALKQATPRGQVVLARVALLLTWEAFADPTSLEPLLRQKDPPSWPLALPPPFQYL